MLNMSEFIEKQEKYYLGDRPNQKRIATPGNQYLLQLILGGYLQEYDNYKGKVLDAGCGAGFNIVTFAMLGWDVYGFDISDEIVSYALSNIRKYGYEAIIKNGSNDAIPFNDEEFDLLLSINSIHYVRDSETMIRNISEQNRILKKGGRTITITTHPNNWILKNSLAIDNNIRRITVEDDFRKGETFFAFNTEEEASKAFKKYFNKVKVGVNMTEFFKKRIVNYIITGVKG